VAETGQPQIFLSTMPAGPGERRIALAIIAVLLVAFAISAPFVAVPVPRIDAFIPIYESILIVNDGITAALLYAQFAILGARNVLVLATGYLFTALIVIPHMLSFPGVFGPAGVLGGGVSSTPWLYLSWHAAFPIAAIGYALAGSSVSATGRPAARRAVLTSIAIAIALVLAATWFAVVGEAYLPPLMTDLTHQASVLIYPAGALWLLAFVAGVWLWWRRRSVLDLWLAVVLCAWLCELLLSVILNPARFTFGFYMGRVYSAVAASIVLVLLLFDTTALYAQLARAITTERRERERRLAEMEAMLSHLSRVGDLGNVVTHLIHEVNQPLAAIGNYLSALQRLIAMNDAEKVASTIEKTIGQSERAREIIRRLRDFVAKREIERRPEPLTATIDDAIAVARASTGRTGIEIEVALDPRVNHVVVDRLQIEQVLVNLIRNASEAMATSPHRRLSIRSRRLDGERVEISVADTGPGLAPELRERLFQPFNTTKPTGMGVGLSICRFIIEAHGETLQVEDNPGGGALFRFTLAVANVASAAAQ
jgi:signal transduction histidine kinase